MVQPKSNLTKNSEPNEKTKATTKKKSCGPDCCSVPTMKKEKNTSRIVVHYDCGFPNTLYVRGSGSNLTWDKGIAMKNEDSNTWFWETEADVEACEFKVLLNDQIYELGSNHSLKKGCQCEYSPQFDFGL